jgi:hypothetical protein
MRYLPILLLAASTAFAQPISEAQQKALADHAAKMAKLKNDRAVCSEIAVKSPVPDPVKVVEWHKMIVIECLKAKGYK